MNELQATDEMFTLVRSAIPTGCIAIWPDKPSTVPDRGLWIKPFVNHLFANNTSLTGAHGLRRFTRRGALRIECYASAGDGQTAGMNLAIVFRTKLETEKNSLIWYRNICIVEKGKDGASTRFDVNALFEYDDFN